MILPSLVSNLETPKEDRAQFLSSLVIKQTGPGSISINGMTLESNWDTARFIYRYKDRDKKINLIIKSDYRQCQNEIDLWENAIIPDDKPYFVPILKHGRFDDDKMWVIQPYLVWDWFDSAYEVPTWIFEKLKSLTERYALDDLYVEPPTDEKDIYWTCPIRNSNWSIWKGHPLIYDYGA